MKLWIAVTTWCEDTDIHGVFTSQARAEEVALRAIEENGIGGRAWALEVELNSEDRPGFPERSAGAR